MSQVFRVTGQELGKWRSLAIRSTQGQDISPREVDWLLQEITNLTALALRLESFGDQAEIGLKISLEDLEQRWQRRLKDRSPLQYLAGSTPWRNLNLQVAPGVLIPRPETEILIDLAIAANQDNSELATGNWVDLGIGSGAISIALADTFPEITVHAVDESPAALAIAQVNISKYNYARRIHLHQGSWWSPLKFLQGKVQGMISNPPYIPTAMIAHLQPEVTNHEPHLALDGGEDGLDDLRHLVNTAPYYLESGGIWLVETMAGQPETVMRLLGEQGSYKDICTFPDFAGIPRFVQATKI
jgi:release factor glutamine methyltransferase